MAILEILPQAENEIEEARDWYSQQAQGLGESLLIEIEKALEVIIERPTLWPIHKRGLRQCMLHKFPYILHYRWDESKDVVTLYAVAHAKRRPGYWFKRTH